MTLLTDIVAVDFETEMIDFDLPPAHEYGYPPVPIGVGFDDGKKREYLAWGHEDGNNCTKTQARRRLLHVYKTRPTVFHNFEFDGEVGIKHLDLPFPDEWHDTLFLAYLYDPRFDRLSLKPLAEKLLNDPPASQDRLKEWILKNVEEATEKTFMMYLQRAPVKLVGRYCEDDCRKTRQLFRWLYPRVVTQMGMGEAYDREIRLKPYLMDMQSSGIKTSTARLKRDVRRWRKQIKTYGDYVVRRLGGRKFVQRFANKDKEFNVGSNTQLADALEDSGLVKKFIMTDKGNRSVSRENLEKVMPKGKLGETIARRNLLLKYCSTYGDKWIEVGERCNGYVFPRINQTRNREDESSNSKGTRTGRLSYNESWQAIPNVERIPYPDFPNLRDYIIPDDDSVILVRDYNQQEFRILAHYEDGQLLYRYKKDPYLDMHTGAQGLIQETSGIFFERRPVKDTGFGLIYGMGLDKLIGKIGCDKETGRILKKAYLAAIPGIKELQKELKKKANRGDPLRTWGGRLYWCEEPRIVKGQLRTFEYKMLNVLIQGSAGDCTKEAIIRANEAIDRRVARIFITVHDEVGLCALRGYEKQQMQLLREAMEGIEFDAFMLSDGKWSARSWGSLKTFREEKHVWPAT